MQDRKLLFPSLTIIIIYAISQPFLDLEHTPSPSSALLHKEWETVWYKKLSYRRKTARQLRMSI